MAKHLAKIHGTEEDKVNCPFFFKIGACRHSDRCSRLHHKPAFSQTLLIKHLYRHPVRQAELAAAAMGKSTRDAVVDQEKAQEDFFCFFEDLYLELSKYGVIEELHVVDNVGDHMIGHVYVKFQDEEMASDALGVLNGRYYDGRVMNLEYSPVTDFREARCRDFDEESCSRGGFCNFLHVKPVPIPLIGSLEEDAREERHRQERAVRERRDDERRQRREKRRSEKRRRSSDDDGDHGDSDRKKSRKRDRDRDRDRRDRGYSPSSPA